jgi:hypothetical protein
VQLTYAEALYDANGQKGDRNDIRDKEVAGLYDELVAGGGRDRRFSPLWWRSWRYLELHVKTAGEPLVIEGLKAFATGFPFEKRARFASDDPELERIFDVSFRTMRLAGHETYMDAPYWSSSSTWAIRASTPCSTTRSPARTDSPGAPCCTSNWSRGGFGMTQSRYPTAEVQS